MHDISESEQPLTKKWLLLNGFHQSSDDCWLVYSNPRCDIGCFVWDDGTFEVQAGPGGFCTAVTTKGDVIRLFAGLKLPPCKDC